MNKKKWSYLLIGIMLCVLFSFAIILLRYNKTPEDIILSLDMFQDEGEFLFMSIPWDSENRDVNRILSGSLKTDTKRQPSPSLLHYYSAQDRYFLDEKQATVCFQFSGDVLKIIKFTFVLDEAYESWFHTQADNMVQTYGPATEVTEQSSADMASIIYKWDTEKTRLHFTLLTGDSMTPTAMIALGGD